MASRIPCYKVILVGEYGVGKSSIFRRFVDDIYTEKKGTIGLDHFTNEFDVHGNKVKIELWDTGGLEKFATLAASYYQSAHAALLCYASDDRHSFGILSQHILDTITRSETVKLFLCGNKADLTEEISVTPSDVQNFQAECSNTVIKQSFSISCKTGENCSEMFQKIAEILHAEGSIKFDPSRVRIPYVDPLEPERKKTCC